MKHGALRPRWRGHPLETYLVENSAAARCSLKRRLIAEGRLSSICAICGLTQWCEQPLSLHLDHINGVNNDNRLCNLRLLCPNCHSQTPTYAGRKLKGRLTPRRPSPKVRLECPVCDVEIWRSLAYVEMRRQTGSRIYCSRRCVGAAGPTRNPLTRTRAFEYLHLLEQTPALSINKAAALMGVNRSNICYWRTQLRELNQLPSLTVSTP